jgi:RNA-binding protein YlmH
MLCYRVVGVRIATLIPRALAFFISTLSDPTERKAIYLTPHKYNFSSTVSEVSVVKMEIPSKPSASFHRVFI